MDSWRTAHLFKFLISYMFHLREFFLYLQFIPEKFHYLEQMFSWKILSHDREYERECEREMDDYV